MHGQDVNNLQQIAEHLSSSGYAVIEDDNQLSTAVVIGEDHYPVALSIIDNALKVTCQLGAVGDLVESIYAGDAHVGSLTENPEMVSAFFVGLLNLNVSICPFATAILSEDDDGDLSNDPVVLIDSVPMGDLSPEELTALMDSLRKGVMIAVRKLGLVTTKA